MKSPIVVCGTGIVGMALALTLVRRGQSVTLLGPRLETPVADADHFHPRVYAISPASQLFLAEIGIWPLLPQARLTRVQAMEIYGDAGGRVDLSAWQDARSEMAWIVEASELERALIQAAQIVGVPWLTDKFASVDQLTVTTVSGATLEAELLVGADGAQSPVRQALHIPTDEHPYGHTGVVAHFTSELPHLDVALQWFRPEGVLALLPLPDTSAGHQVSMVWSLRDDLANELLAMSLSDQGNYLSHHLALATQGRLGRLSLITEVRGFPLVMSKSPMIGDGVALVGDAAHRIHPLAGQGLNLGLGDAQALAAVISEREGFRSAGDPMVLRRYRRARAEHLMAMRWATDGLHRLFDDRSQPASWLRNLGMDIVNKLPLIKRRIVSGASG